MPVVAPCSLVAIAVGKTLDHPDEGYQLKFYSQDCFESYKDGSELPAKLHFCQ